MAAKADVVVIGAGAVGCSVAYYLSKQGASVLLVEREAIGSGASAHATGFLSLLGSEFSDGESFEFGLAAYREFSTLAPEPGSRYRHRPDVPTPPVAALGIG